MHIDISTVLIHVDFHITIHIDIHINSRGLGGAALICQQRCRCSYICWLRLYSDHCFCCLLVDSHYWSSYGYSCHYWYSCWYSCHFSYHFSFHFPCWFISRFILIFINSRGLGGAAVFSQRRRRHWGFSWATWRRVFDDRCCLHCHILHAPTPRMAHVALSHITCAMSLRGVAGA